MGVTSPVSVLSPPPRPALMRGGAKLDDVVHYISNELFNYLTDFYKHAYIMWTRTGAYDSTTFNLFELKVTAQELNTLIGIITTKTVQAQLNEKANISSLGTMAYQNSNNVSITGGAIDTTILNIVTINNSNYVGGSISSADIYPKQGSSLQLMEIGGVATTDMVAIGNVGAVETDLITYTFLANSLDSGNAFIEIEAFGTFASNANNKQVKLYFGSSVLIDTGSVAANAGSWIIHARVIRINSNAQKSITTIISDNSLIINKSSYVTPAEDLTTNIIIKCTGQGTANDDIIQEGLIVKMFNG